MASLQGHFDSNTQFFVLFSFFLSDHSDHPAPRPRRHPRQGHHWQFWALCTDFAMGPPCNHKITFSRGGGLRSQNQVQGEGGRDGTPLAKGHCYSVPLLSPVRRP